MKTRRSFCKKMVTSAVALTAAPALLAGSEAEQIGLCKLVKRGEAYYEMVPITERVSLKVFCAQFQEQYGKLLVDLLTYGRVVVKEPEGVTTEYNCGDLRQTTKHNRPFWMQPTIEL